MRGLTGAYGRGIRERVEGDSGFERGRGRLGGTLGVGVAVACLALSGALSGACAGGGQGAAAAAGSSVEDDAGRTSLAPDTGVGVARRDAGRRRRARSQRRRLPRDLGRPTRSDLGTPDAGVGRAYGVSDASVSNSSGVDASGAEALLARSSVGAASAEDGSVAAASVATGRSWPRSREAPYRVLILGDSMAATDFGKALETILDAHPKIDARRRGRSSSGLARPDFFNWFEVGPKQVRRHDPDLVLVIIGGNDGQDLLSAQGRRRRDHQWTKPDWRVEYAKRTRYFADALTPSEAQRLVLIELPVMARTRLEKKLAVIRSVQKDTLSDHPRAEYLETKAWFFRAKGRQLRTEIRQGKETLPLRQEDGIHFSRPGARWFAERVFPHVVEKLLGDGSAVPASASSRPAR